MSGVAILLLEPNTADAEQVSSALAQDKMDATLDRVTNRAEFRAALQKRRYDLILADFAPWDRDSLAVLEEARELAPRLPVILLARVHGEEFAIEALKRGATDYVVKLSLERLAPAVRRALAEASERAGRKQAQRALRESQELFRLIVESAQDYAIFTLDLQRRITSWNPGAQHLLGYEEAEVIGQDGDIIFTPEDRAQNKGRQETETALARGRAANDRWHLRKDGSRFWASGLTMLLRDDAGAVRGFVNILRDMTEHKRFEDALQETNRRKDEFLAMLAHELRNPLTPVRNALHLLRFQGGNPQTVERLRALMERQVGHLSRLIDDLLEVSRITRGKIALQCEQLDLARQVRLSVEDRRRTLEEAGLTVHLDIPEIPIWISGDATRLAQVLDNLLENVAKFTPRGGRVTVRVADDPAAGQAIVRVQDTGIGMEPELLARLFEPFAQADRSLDRTGGGLGLGLTLARGLLDLHGGRIWAASAGVNQGAEFTFTLPRHPEPAALLREPVAPTPPPSRKRLRILVVEDNRDAAETLRTLLEMFGYEVAVVHTGTAGVEKARQDRPDVVLCDIGLPGMDGFAVASALRQNPETAAARLIAVTGYGQEADRQRALEAGFNEHLTKPVDPEVLLGRLEPEPKA